MSRWEATKQSNGDWLVRRIEVDGFTIHAESTLFQSGSWLGGVSTEMLARNEAARRNGERLPFKVEVQTPTPSTGMKALVAKVAKLTGSPNLPCPLCQQLMQWDDGPPPGQADWCTGCRDIACRLITNYAEPDDDPTVSDLGKQLRSAIMAVAANIIKDLAPKDQT